MPPLDPAPARTPLDPPPPATRPPHRRRRRRWLRRLGFALLAVVGLAVATVVVLRLTRDYEKVVARAALAGGPLVIAHRGASSTVLENSLPSYRRALADGADVLEVDVHLTSDGQIVVSHDADLGRTLGVPGAIAGQTLLGLRAAVAARHPEAVAAELVPTLDEVLHLFPGVRINIELKARSSALAAAVASSIERQGRRDLVVVASFHGEAIDAFRVASKGLVATAAAPAEGLGFYLCFLTGVPCRPAFEVLQIPPRLRRSWPRVSLDTAEFLGFAHRHGLAVHYWTIDEPAEIRRLYDLGADGVMSNAPARAQEARDGWRKARGADTATMEGRP